MTKVKKIAKYLGLGLLVLVLLAVVFGFILNYMASKQLEKEIAEVKASGGVLRFEDLAPLSLSDEENAVLLYEKALALMPKYNIKDSDEYAAQDKILSDGWLNNWTQDDQLALQSLLKKNEETLKLVQKAVGFKHSYLAIGDNSFFPTILNEIKQCILLVAAQARLEMLESKTNNALETCYAGLCMSGFKFLEPTILTHLSRVAYTEIILDTLEMVLEETDQTTDGYNKLIDELDFQKHHDNFIRCLEGERCFVLAMSQKDKVWSSSIGKMLIVYHLNVIKNLVDLTRLSCCVIKDEQSFNYETVKSHWLIRLFAGDISLGLYELYMKQCSFEARLGAAHLAVTLKMYKAQNGSYPDSLSVLAPGIIPKLPKDPFTGKDYIYKREGEGFIVYSLGQNL